VLSDRAQHLDDIPAFVFHDTSRDHLEPMLRFLAENGYRTLTADEYAERQRRKDRGHEREVLLTFDDGCKSLYAVAYPALKRFGLKAVAYIVPGMVPDTNGATTASALGQCLCTWEEIQEMHENGVCDIQSHSMYHHSISISDRVVEFVRPGLCLSFLQSDLAPVPKPPYGGPINPWTSRFSGARAFVEDPSVIEACADEVTGHDGAEYFNRAGWRRRLSAVVVKARQRACGGYVESESEMRAAILKDFGDAKCAIESRLTGKLVRHFCFPWFRGSASAARLSGEAGYISNAWGSLLPDALDHESPVLPIPRLAARYLWRLPGKGRRSLAEIAWGSVRSVSDRWA
jgi:hypothetical protein